MSDTAFALFYFVPMAILLFVSIGSLCSAKLSKLFGVNDLDCVFGCFVLAFVPFLNCFVVVGATILNYTDDIADVFKRFVPKHMKGDDHD